MLDGDGAAGGQKRQLASGRFGPTPLDAGG